MKRMQATITLKQLRSNPRHYVDLLNLGYAVSLTDHGKVLAVVEPASTNKRPKKHKPHTVGAFLEYLDSIEPSLVPTPDDGLTYKERMRKYRLEDYKKLRQEIDARRKKHGNS